MTLYDLLFSFQGRINRTKFWLGLVIYLGISLAWYVAAAFVYSMSQRPEHQTFWVVALFVFIPVALVSLLILLAVGTKRLHDRAKSGTWMIAFLLPALVLNTASEFVDDSQLANKYWFSLGLTIAANAFLIWGLVELGLMPGVTGTNQYGESPNDRLDQ